MTRSNPQPARPADSAANSAATQEAPAGETVRQRARKDEILAAARRILIEEGHHRLTMRKVAERVGIKLASLQYHFPNREELVVALIQSGNETYRDLVNSLLGEVDSSATDPTIDAMLDRVFEEYQDERSLNFHEQIWALSVRDPRMEEEYYKGYTQVWNSAAEIIGRIDPESTEAERRVRAALIIALLDGLEAFLSVKKLRRRLPDTMRDDVAKLIKSIARGEST